MGRPRIDIKWSLVEKLCQIQCTLREVASVLELSEDTVKRAVKRKYKQTFEEYAEEHKGHGRAALRRTMFEMALTGRNVTMCIWLSKQHLGMTDKQQVETGGIKDGLPQRFTLAIGEHITRPTDDDEQAA